MQRVERVEYKHISFRSVQNLAWAIINHQILEAGHFGIEESCDEVNNGNLDMWLEAFNLDIGRARAALCLAIRTKKRRSSATKGRMHPAMRRLNGPMVVALLKRNEFNVARAAREEGVAPIKLVERARSLGIDVSRGGLCRLQREAEHELNEVFAAGKRA